MWVFTQDGFISAVEHRRDKNVLLVRARDRESLEMLSGFTGKKIQVTPNADYRYRIEVTKDQFAEWMSDQIDDIDYDNFKNKVHDNRGDEFAMPLHEVWHTMLQVEDTGKYRRKGLPDDDWGDAALTYSEVL